MKIPQKSSTMSNVATCAPRQHVTRRAKKRLQRALHHGKCPAAPCLLQGKSSRYWEEREDLFQILRPVLCTQALHGVVKPQDPLILERMLHAQLRRDRHHVCLVLVRHVRFSTRPRTPRPTPSAPAPGRRPPPARNSRRSRSQLPARAPLCPGVPSFCHRAFVAMLRRARAVCS